MPQISPPKKNKKKAVPPKDRPVVYPEIVTAVCQGDTALTVEKAKELLGWEEETDDVKFGDDYTLLDYSDPPKKVRLTKCSHNRPYDKGLAARYVQEHLNKRWQINGESRIIGKYGEVISGQHSMSALVLADQARQANPHWEVNWPGPVTMATVIVFGVEETDDVVNTADTGKPRSLSDVLYRSEHFADYYKPKDRKTAARIGDYAIRMLWHRTGADADAFAPKRTHAESLAFLDNHRTLARKVIRHVMEEDKSGGVSAVMSPGYASALAYLMAQSKTDPAKYREKAKEGVRSEKFIDLSMLDKAEEFVLLLGGAESEVGKPVRAKVKELNKRENADGELVPATLAEKIAVITLAWIAFAEGKPIRFPKESELLVDTPTLGGIDLGEDHDEEPADVEEEEEGDDEEAPSEKLRRDLEATRPDRVKALVEQRKAEAKAKKEAMRDAKAPPSNGSMVSVADEIRAQYAPVAEAHPGKVIFFKSKTSGGLTCIDADAAKVSKVLGSPATKDPGGFVRFSVSKADVDKSLPKLLADGLQIAIAEEVLGGNGFQKDKTVKVTDYTGK